MYLVIWYGADGRKCAVSYKEWPKPSDAPKWAVRMDLAIPDPKFRL